MKLSIVVPILNELENIPRLRTSLNSLLAEVQEGGHVVELILNDNRSNDGSRELLSEWAESSKNVVHNRFSQRVSFQQSIVRGFRIASGDCVVVVQGDLQDPPSVVMEFLECWLSGDKTVVGLATNRHTDWLSSLGRSLFYNLFSFTTRDRTGLGFQDFYLLDREVYTSIANRQNHFQFIRGAIATEFGVDRFVEYRREFRKHGRSKFRFAEKYDLALDALLVHSHSFSRYLSVGGLAISLLAGLAVAGFSLAYLLGFDFGVPGWLSVFSVLALILGLFTFFSALQFEYQRRILVSSMSGGDH